MTGHNIFKSILSLFLSYDKTFYTWEVNMARIIDTTEKNLIGHKVKQLRKKHHMSQKNYLKNLKLMLYIFAAVPFRGLKINPEP